MLTVLFATFNGARTLPVVLEAYRKLESPDGGWKVVVADNGSNDGTAAILERFKGLLPLTCLHVTEAGKNHAINAGLALREGDLVVLTDDDAVPATDWLVAMRRAAARGEGFDIFGGSIVARWERAPEPWILEWVPQGVTYAITPKDVSAGSVPARQVWGPNMAVRTTLFDAGHRFDVRIGPKAGTSYVMGSETEFTLRMEQLGHRAWFVPEAVVEHIVRAFQMERRWVLSRAVRYGRSMYHRDREVDDRPPPPTIFGLPRWQLRRTISGALSLAGATLAGNAERAFRNAWTLHFDWGYLAEARSARRSSLP